MRARLIVLAICLLFVNIAAAQTTIAKLKYEEAEEAYLAKDFKTTIEKLNEAQGILKATNPKILYLRIMSYSKSIEFATWEMYQVINYTRSLCAQYLKDYENVPDNEDKYRDIYKASEALNKYPKTEEALKSGYDLFKKAEDEKRLSVERVEKAKQDAIDSHEKLIDSILLVYNFKPDLTFEQFKEYNPHASALTLAIPGVWNNNQRKEGLIEISVQEDKVQRAEYMIKRSEDIKDLQAMYNELKNMLSKNFQVIGSEYQSSDSQSRSTTGILAERNGITIWYQVTLYDFASGGQLIFKLRTTKQ